MAPILPTLAIAIVVVGLLYVIGSHHGNSRRKRAAVARLRVTAPDAKL